MSDEQDEQLSPAGLARRDKMLGDLVGVMERMHRARRLRHRLAASGGSACLLLLLVLLAIPGSSDGPGAGELVETARPEITVPLGAPITSQGRSVLTELVTTDPSVLDRYRANPRAVVIRMNDRMLLDALASIGRPAGLVRFGDDVHVSAPVTDAELGL